MNYKEENSAKIAVNKSLLKEYSNKDYSRIVYLKDNTEFQIQLFNNNQFVVGVDVSINGKSLGNKIILRPGERIWLERYLDSPNKFLFSTYKVNDNSNSVKKAIQLNGNIDIKFYKEKQNYLTNVYDYPTIYFTKTYDNNDSDWFSLTTSNAITNYTSVYSIYNNNALSRCIEKPVNNSNKIETGRVEKGNYSNQKFQSSNVELEYFHFKAENIKILPYSQKPYLANDLKVKYCGVCGRKIKKDNFKYCPYCGNKL